MNPRTRLANCKAYQKEALKNPIANRLYLEDLELSIKMFEEQVEMQTGWVDSEEESV